MKNKKKISIIQQFEILEEKNNLDDMTFGKPPSFEQLRKIWERALAGGKKEELRQAVKAWLNEDVDLEKVEVEWEPTEWTTQQ